MSKPTDEPTNGKKIETLPGHFLNYMQDANRPKEKLVAKNGV